MVTAAVVDSRSPTQGERHHRLRNGSPLRGSDDADFELRHHWRAPAAKRVSGGGGGMRGRRWAPPDIEIPKGGARGYTSLRDIMSSPAAAAAVKAASSCSPDDGRGVHTIRHPLVKHAAYAYLQLTPSAREEARRRRRRRGPLCRLLMGCLGFVGALFGR